MALKRYSLSILGSSFENRNALKFHLKIKIFSNLYKLNTKIQLLVPWSKKWCLRSSDPKLGIFWVIWGQIQNIFKPVQFQFQNTVFGKRSFVEDLNEQIPPPKEIRKGKAQKFYYFTE